MTQLTSGILANCADCGYDLRGQQESARCPECGRLNIPEAYRQEVHDLVDRGRWFFSSPFSLFTKRPPGWFWSLDRPGDVGRSFRRAGAYIILSSLLIFAAVALANSCTMMIESTYVSSPVRRVNQETGELETLPGKSWVDREVVKNGALGVHRYVFGSDEILPANDAPAPGVVSRLSFASGVDRTVIGITLLLSIVLIGTWLFPAMAGLWTQVRKGLPGFARASSTVIAACNYEAHRLVYVAALVAGLMAVETLIRVYVGTTLFSGGPRARLTYADVTVAAVFAVPWVYAVMGWVGALRSDFTKQIVRSRWHAARIIWMYAISFTAVLTLNTFLLLKVLGIFE